MSEEPSSDIGLLRRVRKIGHGAFSDVYCYRHIKTRLHVAVKVIALTGMSDDDKRHISREVRIHRSLSHTNIVELFAPIVSDEYAYMIMEMCDGGNLFSFVQKHVLKRLPLEDVRSFFRQMAAAVDYIHANGVIHRDIKPSNFLLQADLTTIKLTDFGLSAPIEPGELKITCCGTPNYIAPEIAEYKASNTEKRGLYSLPADIWSLGCCFYFMFVGRCPFERETLEETFAAIVRNDQNYIPTRVMIGFDDNTAPLMDDMLETNPLLRITAREIVEHPFLR